MSSKVEDKYSYYTEQPDENPPIYVSPFDPIIQYNKFIRIYNKDNNRVNGIELKLMKQSKIVRFVHNYLRNYIGISILICVFLLLPFINILFYGLLWIAWYKLYQNGLIYNQNLKLVIDPLQNMVENNDICQMMNQDYWEFNMDVGQSDGLIFSSQIKDMIKKRSKGNSKIQYTVYNESFKQQFYNYPNSKLLYMKWILMFTLLLAVQMTLMIIFFKDL